MMLYRLTHFTHRRNGRRRTLLGLIGLIWLAYGWALGGGEPSAWRFGRLGPGPIEQLLYSHWTGLLWLGCGLVGITAAGWRRIPDSLGFNALLVPPLLWMVLYGWSWLIWVYSRGEYGSSRSWVQAVMWSCAVVVLLITSGWPDPDEPEKKAGGGC